MRQHKYDLQKTLTEINEANQVAKLLERDKVKKCWYILQVEADGTHDVFIRGKLGINNICVIHDVSAEDETAANRIYELHGTIEWDEELNETRHHCEMG